MLGLPREGTALARAIDERGAYTTEAHLTARNSNLLAELVWLTHEVNRDPKNSKPLDHPQPIELGKPPPSSDRLVEAAPASVHEQKPQARVETDHDTIMRFFGQPTPVAGQVEGPAGRVPRVPIGTAANPN